MKGGVGVGGGKGAVIVEQNLHILRSILLAIGQVHHSHPRDAEGLQVL